MMGVIGNRPKEGTKEIVDIISSTNGKEGLVVLSDCPACRGTIHRYRAKTMRRLAWEERNLFQCIHCGRLYTRENGVFVQWPKHNGTGKDRGNGSHW